MHVEAWTCMCRDMWRHGHACRGLGMHVEGHVEACMHACRVEACGHVGCGLHNTTPSVDNFGP